MPVTLDFDQAQPVDPVALDFSKAQPISAKPGGVRLDFSKAQPLSPVQLDFSKAQPLDPNDRLFAGTGPAEIRAYVPSVWDKIRSLFGKPSEPGLNASPLTQAVGSLVPQGAVPALAATKKYAVDPLDKAAQAGANVGREAGRDLVSSYTLLSHPDYLAASLPSPYGPKPSVMSPEKLAEQEHPIAMGVAGGVGSVVGSTISDPRNWPFFASSAVRPMLQKLIARGFSAQMGVQTYQGAKDLYDNWDRLTPEQRAELGAKTGVGALFLAKGLAEGGKKSSASETPTHITHAVDPSSPLGQVLAENAPDVRVADSAAAARDLIEKDTVAPPVAPGEFQLTHPPSDIGVRNYIKTLHDDYQPYALEVWDAVSAPGGADKPHGVEPTDFLFNDRHTADLDAIDEHLRELAGKQPSPANTQARVSGPRDTAAFVNPTARVVTDSHISVVSQDAVLAHAVTNILSNSSELRNAGVDVSAIKTSGDIDAALMRASNVIKSGLADRAHDTLTFEMQKDLATQLNMTVEDLLSHSGGTALNAENLLAARMLLKESYNHVLELARSGDTDAAMTALSQHKAIQERVAGVRAEAGRGLGSFRIGAKDLPATKIQNVFEKLPPDVQAETVKLVSKLDQNDPQSVRALNKMVEKIKPSTTLDKLFEYYRNALLSSPHTIIVKTASEASMAAMEAMKKVVAGGISKMKSSPDRFIAESWYYAKGMAQALSEHAKPILSGEFQLEGSPGFERAGQQAIKGVTGQIVRAPSEAMSRATNLIYAGNYFGELNALAARQAIVEGLDGDAFHARQEYLAHHPDEAMQEEAHRVATTNTFQNELTGFTQKVGQAITTKPNVKWLPEWAKGVAPGRWLFPFFKTPVNLVKASLTHATPYELLNARGNPDALARGVLGSSISAAIVYLALNGTITGGGPTDFRKEETKRATGWQPYSIKIGHRYVSYKRFEPLGLTMGLIADAIHGNQSGDSEVVAQSKTDTAVKHVMRNLDDLPFLGTLANLLQAVHDPVGGRAQSFINREAGSVIPAGVANVAETIDPTVRRPQTALQAIESRIPGLTSAAAPIADITGHTVQRPTSNLGGANPFPFTTAKHDPVVDELARLGISTPQPPTQIKCKGKTTPLTDAERQAFAQAEGQELYKRVGRLMQSGSWQKRTDDQKRKALVELHRIISEARPARLTQLRRQAVATE